MPDSAPSSPSPADDLTEARRIADGLQFACRLPDKKPDFFACGGPAAEAYWDYFTPARILSLLAALDEARADRDALRAALGRHLNWFTNERGLQICAGCLSRWDDCPDRGLLNGGTDG